MTKKAFTEAKICAQCGKLFNRGRLRSGRAESLSDYKVRILCSRKCSYLYRTGSNHYAWKGGVRKRPDGYLRYSDDRYVHRVVMEKHLGRPLNTDEHIHHIDGNPENNDIINLMIVTNREHRKIESLIAPRDSSGRFAKKGVTR